MKRLPMIVLAMARVRGLVRARTPTALAGVVGLFLLAVTAVLAAGYEETSTVDGITITFRASTDTAQTRADVAAGKAAFDDATANSAHMKSRVLAVAENFTVSADRSKAIAIGAEDEVVVHFDPGDIERAAANLSGGTPANRAVVSNNLLKAVIAHEVCGRSRVGHDHDDIIADENTVLNQLETGVQRDDDCYIDDKGTPDDPADDEAKQDYTVGGNTVTWNITNTDPNGQYAEDCLASVGGIVDAPLADPDALAQAAEGSGSSLPYAAIAGGAAATAVALVAGGWYVRRRLS